MLLCVISPWSAAARRRFVYIAGLRAIGYESGAGPPHSKEVAQRRKRNSGMIELKPLSSLSFAEAVELWNEGFQGYSVDLSMSLNDYLTRLHTTSVSIEKSLVAKVEGRPVGFLLNAIRHHAGQVVAWNGGTGVIPQFRSQGVGRVLVAGALKIYAEAKVDCATLEAISTNAPAIALYKSCGYDAVDELTFLRHTGKLHPVRLCRLRR